MRGKKSIEKNYLHHSTDISGMLFLNILCNNMQEQRRKEAQTAELTEKHVFKGVRYLLLKGQESIETVKSDDIERDNCPTESARASLFFLFAYDTSLFRFCTEA
ncbi:MAG TPA: hypothetical protein VMZ04_02650, partial [Anaerolineae bacterium]|nr:hypothetical protein [Anaerolineae bacterium]